MSYSDFISTLGYGCSLIFDGIVTVASSLINNYIVLTLLGLSLFTFVVYTIVDILFIPKQNKDNLDNYGGDKK